MKHGTNVPGGGVIAGVDQQKADRVTKLIAELNAQAARQAGNNRFVACLRENNEWGRIDPGPSDAFQCAMVAASLSEAHGVVTGVFTLDDAGEAEGPHLTFGPAPLLVGAWVHDCGFGPLSDGAANSVVLNAGRIALASATMSRGSETEH